MNAIDRPHWSYSALAQYLRCPRQFLFDRLLGLPRRTCTEGQVLGTAVHAALAAFHEGLRCARPLSPDIIRKVFLQSWCDRQQQETIIFRDGEQREESLARGIALVDAYMEEPPPSNILAVERPLIAPLVDRDGHYLEKPLIAVPDLILRDKAGLRVVDFKTAARSISASEAATSIQASCYVHAAWAVYGVPVGFEFAALLKTKIPRVQRVETSRTDADSNRLGELVASVERAIAADVFHAIESPINCATCPFRRPCREWGMESSRPSVSPQADTVNALPHLPSGTGILAQ